MPADNNYIDAIINNMKRTKQVIKTPKAGLISKRYPKSLLQDNPRFHSSERFTTLSNCNDIPSIPGLKESLKISHASKNNIELLKNISSMSKSKSEVVDIPRLSNPESTIFKQIRDEQQNASDSISLIAEIMADQIEKSELWHEENIKSSKSESRKSWINIMLVAATLLATIYAIFH